MEKGTDFKVNITVSLLIVKNSGIMVYTTHLGEDNVFVPAHGTPLDPSLTPTITMQNEKRTYLGMPFTDCIKSNGMNSHIHSENLERIKEKNVYRAPSMTHTFK